MLQIRIKNLQQELQLTHRTGRLSFGRIARNGPDWVTLIDDYVSREQMEIEERDGRLTITNNSKRVPITLSSSRTIPPGETAVEVLPLAIRVGGTDIQISADLSAGGTLMTIHEPVRPRDVSRTGKPLGDISAGPDSATLLKWFETIVSVQRAAAGSDAFYRQTAEAVVNLVGLDYGMVLLRSNDSWNPVASYAGDSHVRTSYSKTILERAAGERRTYYQLPEMDTSASLIDVASVVASPIFDAADPDKVVGAVYGARTSRQSGLQVEIRPLEAQLMQVLAAAVGAGLARMESEEEAREKHERFVRFFSKELAGELDRDPHLLDGRERTITCLFADIRGFSRISERMGAEESVELLGSVMNRLTECIHQHKGVLVTYLGDGLLAMWNAPIDQPDHASLACRAGLACLGELPKLNEQWQSRIGAPLRLGVGVNTGPARVGNTGSESKLHYGPLGPMVNLASRVESATKQLGIPMLITGATREGLGPEFVTRRICHVRLMGIAEPVDLFEPRLAPAPPEWLERRKSYETALEEYEAGRWSAAGRLLQPFLSQQADYDVPSLTLLGRCLDCLKLPPQQFDPVWDLQGK